MGNRPEQVELGSKMLNAPSDIEVKGLIQISRSPESFSPGLSANVELAQLEDESFAAFF